MRNKLKKILVATLVATIIGGIGVYAVDPPVVDVPLRSEKSYKVDPPVIDVPL